MKKLCVLWGIVLLGCSSVEIIDNWKNPDIVLFDADKVLIVGMTQNMEARTAFESKLLEEFNHRNVEAMRSLDVFDVEFTSSERSEEELETFEQQLLDKDFDAILFTKVIGTENIVHYKKDIANLDRYFDGFEEDYIRHQDIYYDPEYYANYTVYHVETSLYCICVGKERELIWRGAIDITDPVNVERSIDDYVHIMVTAMEDQDLIFRKETLETDIDL